MSKRELVAMAAELIRKGGAMESISTLVQDDPYLRLPARERIALRRDRRLKLFAPVEFNVTPSMTDPPVLPPIPNKEIRLACEMTTTKTYGRVETIQRAVLKFFPYVTLYDINSNRRTAKVVKPRQIAMYLARTMTNRSFPDIGRRFGFRDHSTILHSVNKITALIKTDPELAALIDNIAKNVGDC